MRFRTLRRDFERGLFCGRAPLEPSPRDLLQRASANLKTAKTTHIEGTGTFARKDGMGLSFDFKISGDAELADNAITIGGRT